MKRYRTSRARTSRSRKRPQWYGQLKTAWNPGGVIGPSTFDTDNSDDPYASGGYFLESGAGNLMPWKVHGDEYKKPKLKDIITIPDDNDKFEIFDAENVPERLIPAYQAYIKEEVPAEKALEYVRKMAKDKWELQKGIERSEYRQKEKDRLREIRDEARFESRATKIIKQKKQTKANRKLLAEGYDANPDYLIRYNEDKSTMAPLDELQRLRLIDDEAAHKYLSELGRADESVYTSPHVKRRMSTERALADQRARDEQELLYQQRREADRAQAYGTGGLGMSAIPSGAQAGPKAIHSIISDLSDFKAVILSPLKALSPPQPKLTHRRRSTDTDATYFDRTVSSTPPKIMSSIDLPDTPETAKKKQTWGEYIKSGAGFISNPVPPPPLLKRPSSSNILVADEPKKGHRKVAPVYEPPVTRSKAKK